MPRPPWCPARESEAVSSNATRRDIGRAAALLVRAVWQHAYRKILGTYFVSPLKPNDQASRQKFRCRGTGNFVPSTPFHSMTAAIFVQRSVHH